MNFGKIILLILTLWIGVFQAQEEYATAMTSRTYLKVCTLEKNEVILTYLLIELSCAKIIFLFGARPFYWLLYLNASHIHYILNF